MEVVNMSTTDNLNQAIKSSEKSIDALISENEAKFTDGDLGKYLCRLADKTMLSKAEIIRRSNLDRTYAYQIFEGKKHPTRDKLLQLCFGFGLSVDETQKLLKQTGFSPLYSKNKRDFIIMHAIEHGISVINTDEELEAHNQRMLIENLRD
jgi:transcriptional regulator with XRE-family HTH domain